MAKHYKKIKKSLLVKLIIIILIIVIISGIGYIIFKLCNSHKEEENYEKLAEYIQNDGYTNNQKNEEISQEKTERMLKLNELHKQNEDIVAWIEIPNSNISYPVLQSNDNDYYLNRNYQKQYSEIGSIFLDIDLELTTEEVFGAL